MSSRGRDKTGGNTEPMPFVRKFGAAAIAAAAAGESIVETIKSDENENGVTTAKTTSTISASRSRSRSRSHSSRRKPHKRSSRSRERSSKRRSRSRDRRKRSRSGSKSGSRRRRRSKSRSRDRRSRSRKSRSSRSRSRSRDRRRRHRERTPSPPKDPSAEAQASPATDINSALAKIKPTPGVLPLLARPDIVESLASGDGTGAGDASPANPEQSEKKTRKSRWSATKSFVPGMPTILPSNLSDDQRQAYLLQLEVEDATRKLRLGDFMGNPDPALRSPSPEPIYDASGKRLNTREIRKRQELEQLRHEKIQALLKLNPNFKPPADYRAPMTRLHDKVWIPQENHPEINFVGLLIGPRGNTLKSLEAETGAKIIIRGKGSVKEGKLGRREGPMPGENEPLHAYVTGMDTTIIKRACEKIKAIINEALMIPDGQNELRKLQLRELALLNGTLRPEDLVSGARCSNCGSDEHKTWECPDAPNVTASIICTACGAAGHIAKDCKNPRPGSGAFSLNNLDAGMDDEYSALMEELGEKPPTKSFYGGAPGNKPSFGGASGGNQGGGYKPRYPIPSGTPIVRINLMKPQNQQQNFGGQPQNSYGGPPTGGGPASSGPSQMGGPPSESVHFFNQPSSTQGRMSRMGGPPIGGTGQWSGPMNSSGGTATRGGGGWGGVPPPPTSRYPMPVPPPPPPMALGFMPPPPPPPAPAPKMDLSSLLAPPAPPPPPPA
uniref:Branchpoint-bridging protein n=1 Tax=Parascaris univalens TaxID=6257 RepID=A0A915AE17_PARUN